jgi:general stress protein 26
MSRRDRITMSPGEVDAFLQEQRTLVCASQGARGWPHLMPLWYVLRGGELWSWTYAKSQKIRNLERDDRATLQVEGGGQYDELRGVMIEANAVIHRDAEIVARIGLELLHRYQGEDGGSEVLDAIRVQAAKRVALQFVAQRTASWDHRKLQGVY